MYRRVYPRLEFPMILSLVRAAVLFKYQMKEYKCAWKTHDWRTIRVFTPRLIDKDRERPRRIATGGFSFLIGLCNTYLAIHDMASKGGVGERASDGVIEWGDYFSGFDFGNTHSRRLGTYSTWLDLGLYPYFPVGWLNRNVRR